MKTLEKFGLTESQLNRILSRKKFQPKILITSNCVGIILSSISIIMYYYYRKEEEYGNCDCGLGLTGIPIAAGVGNVKRPTKGGTCDAGTRAILHQVPLCGGGGNDNRSRATGQNLRQVPKVQIVNICINCHRFWVNDQGWPRYLNLEEAGEKITEGATKRFNYCPSCKGEFKCTEKS